MNEDLGKIKDISVGIEEFRVKNPLQVKFEKTISQKQAEICAALNQFMECVRYLNTRRSKGTVLTLSSENDVQDALYIMLRPWITDLKYEDPTSKTANRFVIKDFFVPSAETVIEAKYVRDKRHGKEISKELHDDIEMYRQRSDCNLVIFFIYDPNDNIPSAESLKSSIEVDRVYGGKPLKTMVIIKP
jgi:hypothetical protein